TVHPIVALLVLALGPLAILTSYIFMLRVLRESLPWAQAARSRPDDDDRHNTLVDGFGSVLLPFVAVYTSQGFLQSDVDSFKIEVQRDAASTVLVNTLENKPIEAGTRAAERLILYPTWWVLGTILVILLLRQIVLKGRGPKGRLWFGIIGAYIEMIFFTLL